MGQIGFKARLVAPYFAEIPPAIRDGWLNGSKKAVSKTYKGLKKAIKTRKDFDQKIAKPTEKTVTSFIDPKFVSRSGRTYDEIMDKTRDSLAGAAKRYFKARKTVYESGKFEEKLGYGQKEYGRKWCKFIGPLRGYQKGGVKGLSALGVMALSGDPGIKNFLKDRIDTMDGTPIDIADRSGFKRILANRIVRWGTWIIELGYEQKDVTAANEKLNQLVNEYRREEIIPFSPAERSGVPTDVGDGASYINFIAVEIPNPLKPGEQIKQLGLDIKVTQV
jgi:hypothetical protein